MRRRAQQLAAALAAAAACCLAVPAEAQVFVGRSLPHAGSVEVSGGVTWSQGFDQGSSTAQLTRNPGTGSGSYDLFTTSSDIGPAVGVQGRVGVYLTRALSVEGGLQYARPELSTAISNDAEEADDVTATETLARYIVDGSVLFHFGRPGANVAPYVIAGGGYVRELHDGYGVVATGNEVHGGVGVKYWFSNGRRRIGIRAEAGAMSRSGGIDFEDGRRTVVTASASLAYLF